MTGQGEALLAAVLACPEDDAPRLIYADYLEGQGRDARAEFIRVQVGLAACGECGCDNLPRELAGLPAVVGMRPPCECRWCALRRRMFELYHAGEAFDFRPTIEWHVALVARVARLPAGMPGVIVSRGFVHAVTCSAEDWLAHGDAVTAAQPIEDVTLTTWPDFAALLRIWMRKGKPSDGRLVGAVTEDTLRCCWHRVKAWHMPPPTDPGSHVVASGRGNWGNLFRRIGELGGLPTSPPPPRGGPRPL